MLVKRIASLVSPESIRQRARRRRFRTRPPVGSVRFGDLRRLTPISRTFGFDRGRPIDRYYIEKFLDRHAGEEGYGIGDIHGHVLEIGDDRYTRQFGGWRGEAGGSPVEKLDVLHVQPDHVRATIIGDLTRADHIRSESFDCIICTQTLHSIYNVRSAVQTLCRLLKPNGALLATVPGITQTCRPDRDLWGDYWRFTALSARRTFDDVFRSENVTVDAYGNVLAATAFLHGIAAEELKPEELDLRDPDYEVLITVRAVKGEARSQLPGAER